MLLLATVEPLFSLINCPHDCIYIITQSQQTDVTIV